MKRIVLGVIFLALLAAPGFAGPIYYQYNLAALGLANADANKQPWDSGWFGLHGGDKFAQGNFSANLAAKTPDPGLQADPYLASVPFSIGQGGSANESWSGMWAPGGTGSGEVDLAIPTNAERPNVVFLMMNTFWGSTSISVDVVLSFAGGGTQTVHLGGGSKSSLDSTALPTSGPGDIRDHNDAPFYYNNPANPYWTSAINPNLHSGRATINETTCVYREGTSSSDPNGPCVSDRTSNPGSYYHRVFRDVVVLYIDPAYRYDTLTQILIKDLGHFASGVDPTASRVWLWGATVGSSPIPEPSTWMMLAGGLGLIALRLRRR